MSTQEKIKMYWESWIKTGNVNHFKKFLKLALSEVKS
jgi:hypothetical protein